LGGIKAKRTKKGGSPFFEKKLRKGRKWRGKNVWGSVDAEQFLEKRGGWEVKRAGKENNRQRINIK